MPKYTEAQTFTLHSVDHDEALLSTDVHSARHLIGESGDMITPEKLTFSFTHNGQDKKVVLSREAGAVKAGAVVHMVGDDGKTTKVEAPPTFAYYSEDRNTILAFHSREKFSGIIISEEDQTLSHFVGQEGKLVLDGDANELPSGARALEFKEKNSSGKMVVDYWDNCHNGQSSGLSRFEIGGAVGNAFYQRYGDNYAAEYNAMIVETNTIYERQMDVSISIASFVVATTGGSTPWASCSSANGQLDDLTNWSPPEQFVVWHLIDDCFSNSDGILGVAYLSVLCSSFRNTGLSYISEGNGLESDYPSWTTVAHELGHNFAAQHSFEQGQGNTGGIMDYGPINDRLIDGEVQFNSQYRENEVCNEVNSVVTSCPYITLGVGSPVAAPVAAPTPGPDGEEPTPPPTLPPTSPPVCDNPWGWGCVTPDYVTNMVCVKRKNVAVRETGNVFKQKSEASLQECMSACDAKKECSTVTYSDRTGFCELVGVRSEKDLYHAADYDTYFCSTEEENLPEVAESLDDILDTADVGEIEAACCETMVGKTFLGMNYRTSKNSAFEYCKNSCVVDSKCAAVDFHEASGLCTYFDFEGASTSQMINNDKLDLFLCDTECVEKVATGGEVAVNKFGAEVVVAGVAAAVVVVAVAAVALFKRRQN